MVQKGKTIPIKNGEKNNKRIDMEVFYYIYITSGV